MSDRGPSNSSRPFTGRSFGLAWAFAALGASLFLAWIIVALVSSQLSGHSTFLISALAAGICWMGAMLSLFLLQLLRLRGSPIAGVMLGMLIRMSIPLVIVAMATMQGGALAESGLVGQLVAFYLITLAIETCLSVALMKSTPLAVSTRTAAPEMAAAPERGAAHG